MKAGIKILILFSYLIFSPLVNFSFVFAKSGKTYYRVRAGDRLEKIAEKFHVEASDLQKWNNIRDPDRLVKGQRLLVLNDAENHSGRLAVGQAIILEKPADKWQILKGYRSYGDSGNPGILCQLLGSSAIRPANDGVIVRISQLRGYGKYILIDHGNGWHSMYSHLDSIKVRLGQRVSLSDTIGNAKDNKLFFLLAYNGKPVNPIGYFKR